MRRDCIGLVGGAATTWPLAARAQQPTFQVGFLYPGPQAAASPRIAAYSSGLQAGGIPPEQGSIIPRVTGGGPGPPPPPGARLAPPPGARAARLPSAGAPPPAAAPRA